MSRPDAVLSRAAIPPDEGEGRAVPKHLLDDPIGRAWLAVHVIDHPTRGWDSADVDFALEQATTCCARSAGASARRATAPTGRGSRAPRSRKGG